MEYDPSPEVYKEGYLDGIVYAMDLMERAEGLSDLYRRLSKIRKELEEQDV